MTRPAMFVALLLLVAAPVALSADDFDDELYSVIDSYRDGSLWAHVRHARSVDSVPPPTPRNESFSDNSLWNDLWRQCRRSPSFACIKTGVFKYLDRNLDGPDDLEVTDHLTFRRNRNRYGDYCENSDEARERCSRYNQEKVKAYADDGGNEISAGDGETSSTTTTTTETVTAASGGSTPAATPTNETSILTTTSNIDSGNATETTPVAAVEEEDITEGAVDGRSVASLSDLSDILYDRGTQFLMTHDLEFQLPETFFGGGSIKIEPKSYEVGGAGDEDDAEEEGTMVKIVFKPPPPQGHVVRGRVIHHLKKLFKKKLMHSFMALMLIIKMIKVKVMFLLPMIIGQSTAKKLLLKTLLFLIPGLAHLFKLCHYYHMEHAKYHHHHHKIKHHHHTVQVPVPVPVPVHHPPPHHPGDDHFPGYPPSPDYSSYHPGPPHPYPPHPGDHDYDYHPSGSSHGNNYYSHYSDNEAAMASWGLGSNNYHEAGVLDAKDQPSYPPYPDAGPYYNKQAYGSNSYQDTSYYQNDITGSGQKQFYGSKLQLLSQKSPHGGGGLHSGPDPFYSPIIRKVDDIFVQMGFTDEGCKERLVCSMYKAPHRFSPHSNLISNELSRDSRELQKPIGNNEDVLRFYRYVQAARDGQEQKDCLILYPLCHINTEN